MTKAVILSNKGKGLYSARIEYDTDRLDGQIASEKAYIEAAQDRIDEQAQLLSDAEAAVIDAKQALNTAIDNHQQAPTDDTIAAIKERSLALTKAQMTVGRINQALRYFELAKLSAEQRLSALESAREERIEDVWCADYTVNLQPNDKAGLIWPDIDANKLPIVMPGGQPSGYSAAVKSENAIGPASSFFNRAIMPILQRIKPRHKIGVVKALNDDGTLDVTLKPDRSKFGRVNTVIEPDLSSVPVEYMRYGAMAFDIGDDAVVRFDGSDQTDPVVIGFEHDPRVVNGFFVDSSTASPHLITYRDGFWRERPGGISSYRGVAEWQRPGWLVRWEWGGARRYDTSPHTDINSYLYIQRLGGATSTVYAGSGNSVIGGAMLDDDAFILIAAREFNVSARQCRLVVLQGVLSGGALTELDSIVVSLTRDGSDLMVPFVAPTADGRAFVFCRASYSSVILTRFDVDGGFAATELREYQPLMVFDGGETLDVTEMNSTITGQFVDEDGKVVSQAFDINYAFSVAGQTVEKLTKSIGASFPGLLKVRDGVEVLLSDVRTRTAVYLYESVRFTYPYTTAQAVYRLVLYIDGEKEVLYELAESVPVGEFGDYKQIQGSVHAGGIRTTYLEGEPRTILHARIRIYFVYGAEDFEITVSRRINPDGGWLPIQFDGDISLGIVV
jgi:hypothetical protein